MVLLATVILHLLKQDWRIDFVKVQNPRSRLSLIHLGCEYWKILIEIFFSQRSHHYRMMILEKHYSFDTLCYLRNIFTYIYKLSIAGHRILPLSYRTIRCSACLYHLKFVDPLSVTIRSSLSHEANPIKHQDFLVAPANRSQVLCDFSPI